MSELLDNARRRKDVLKHMIRQLHDGVAPEAVRTQLVRVLGQVPYGGRVMQTIINLWRGQFLETYLSRYFALHPDLNRNTLTPWLIPVAAGRMNEGIAGEREALLGVIEASVAAL